MYWYALRSLVLAASLVAYGAVPSTPAAPAEVESQLQEELASAHHEAEYLSRLRGVALRRVERIAAHSANRRAAVGAYHMSPLVSPGVSAGLVLPLRC